MSQTDLKATEEGSATSAARETDVYGSAYGAFLGLAMGDAVGLPALFHRLIPHPDKRAMLWKFGAELDLQRINKLPMPYTLGRPEPLYLSGTDDTEFAVLAARILLECGPEPTPEQLLDGWVMHIVDREHEIWSGSASAPPS